MAALVASMAVPACRMAPAARARRRAPAGRAVAQLRAWNGYDTTRNLVHPGLARLADGTWLLTASTHDDVGAGRGGPWTVENTVLFASHDLTRWRPVPALGNPILARMDVDTSRGSVFTDPEPLRIGPARLAVYSRLATSDGDSLFVRATDLRTLSDYQNVLGGPANTLVSPTVLGNDGGYQLWSVSSAGGCSADSSVLTHRESSSWDDFRSAAVDTTDAAIPGWVLWHPAMVDGPRDRPDSLILLVAAYPDGFSSCDSSSVFLGTTADGLHFRIAARPLKERMYRSSGWYDAESGKLTVVYSYFDEYRTDTRLAQEVYDYDSLMTALFQDSAAGTGQ